MNILITKRIQTIIILNALLSGASSNLYGREADGFLARPIAWVASCFDRIKKFPSHVRSRLPKERLAYKAAQVHGEMGTELTEEQRAILVKNLQRFKELLLNAHNHPEAQRILESIIAPELIGKEHQFKGALLYATQYAEEEDKPFLLSPLGTQSLSQLLRHAPSKQQTLSKIERILCINKAKSHIALQAEPILIKINALQATMKQAEHNPEISAFNNDPILLASQQKLEKIHKVLKEKEPELEKLMPLLEQKNKETETKIRNIAEQKNLSQTEKERQAQLVAEEMRTFLAQYPLVQEMVELEQEQMNLATELQNHVKKLATQYPAVQQLALLMQEEPALIDAYNEWAYADQNLLHTMDEKIVTHTNALWRSHVDTWFDACIKAIQENAQPEDHILFHEHRMNAELSDWHAVIKGWKDLDAYSAYRTLNTKNWESTNLYLDKQYERFNKTEEDIRKQLEQEISQLTNLPSDTLGALKTLDILDIDPKTLNASHKDRIKKQYRLQSRKHHPDKNPTNPNATKEQEAITKAYSQLNNLIDTGTATLTPEQQEEYATLQKLLTKTDVLLQREYEDAQRAIDALENPRKHEKILKRALTNNAPFNRLFPHEVTKARRLVALKVGLTTLQNSIPSESLSLKDRT